MVVTRRTPAAPVPTSRNPSSQPIPHIAKKPDQDTQSLPNKSSPLSSGTTLDTTNKAHVGETDSSVSVLISTFVSVTLCAALRARFCSWMPVYLCHYERERAYGMT
ncbi:hypothetical protein BD311DRAFT_219584 [Dichomitus squalens]|uniref:Uncharacterized protein n=1 Tax=Dichomitus squalens TaxID=114155 RepID=A0A4Q9MS06_9APHY|nr:hypothetical protein BD311DRAFT_219584 [Dichomitus squalens]